MEFLIIQILKQGGLQILQINIIIELIPMKKLGKQ